MTMRNRKLYVVLTTVIFGLLVLSTKNLQDKAHSAHKPPIDFQNSTVVKYRHDPPVLDSVDAYFFKSQHERLEQEYIQKLFEDENETGELKHLKGKNLSPKGQDIVIITACDYEFISQNETRFELTLKNRIEYAAAHNYIHTFINTTEMTTPGDYPAWNKVVAIREAFRQYPSAKWFWWLDADALIMNYNIDLASHVLNHEALRERLTYSRPIRNEFYKFVDTENQRYPPKGKVNLDKIDLILSQDPIGWNAGSMFLRNSEFTKMFLEVWDDRVFRDIEWYQHEQSVLTYLATTHKSIMAHIGSVSQSLINSYHDHPWQYQSGDLVVHFAGATKQRTDYHKIWDNAYKSRIYL